MTAHALLYLSKRAGTPTRVSRPAGRMALVLTAVLSGACNGFDPVPTRQTTDPAQLYFTLAINHPAVNLSTMPPYDTLQLTATPQNALGEPMTGLPAPTFRLEFESDSAFVKLTPDGLIQARAATPERGVTIRVTLAVPGGGVHSDVGSIYVIDNAPPTVTALSADPLPPDSARQTMSRSSDDGDLFIFPFQFFIGGHLPAAHLLDAGGNPIGGKIAYKSLNPKIAAVGLFNALSSDPFVSLYALNPGQLRVVARTMAYGVSLVDTAVITVTWPVLQWVYVVSELDEAPHFQPSDIRIAPYGLVVWKNRSGETVDITFDNPTNVADPSLINGPGSIACSNLTDPYYGPGPHCGPGNAVMPPPLPNPDYPSESTTIQIRQFPVPGVYTYHSTRTGASGRIIVSADPDPTAMP